MLTVRLHGRALAHERGCLAVLQQRCCYPIGYAALQLRNHNAPHRSRLRVKDPMLVKQYHCGKHLSSCGQSGPSTSSTNWLPLCSGKEAAAAGHCTSHCSINIAEQKHTSCAHGSQAHARPWMLQQDQAAVQHQHDAASPVAMPCSVTLSSRYAHSWPIILAKSRCRATPACGQHTMSTAQYRSLVLPKCTVSPAHARAATSLHASYACNM
jgi:hypothetical protein